MTAIRTGELARRAGVGVETLRFYEREGLLPKPPQRASGYRDYPPEAVDLVRFIRRAQALGFTLKEVRELLALREVPRATCGDVVVLARHKVAEIDAKLADLRAMRAALTGLLKGCTGAAPIARCPIIESLAGQEAEPAGIRRRQPGGAKGADGCCVQARPK
jgi:MerR family mercuric resistance operon transcriptional regulator